MTIHDVPREVTYQGRTLPLSELCRNIGVRYQLVYSRLRAGWTLTDAIEKLPRPTKPTSRELKRYEYLGEKLTINELAEKSTQLATDSAVPSALIRARIIKGWSVEDAVEVAPVPKGGRRRTAPSKQREIEPLVERDDIVLEGDVEPEPACTLSTPHSREQLTVEGALAEQELTTV